MNFTLNIWRQADAHSQGSFQRYRVEDISPDISFLEMLDLLNQKLTMQGESPVAFDSDCREGICGMCSLMINGEAHGQMTETTTCQLYMRHFNDGEFITVEPWRAKAFPVLRDLIVDRSALDRIIQAGGYISVHTGPKPDPNAIPIPPEDAELALDAATCIGCGACVAACPNASAMLFTAAKISHLGILPQGQPERYTRVTSMLDQMQAEGFGGCRNTGECQHACPKGISIAFIGRLNRDFLHASLHSHTDRQGNVEAI
jgi:succinate dehydrogenase / fumarate reductase iron-sulfur subunit